MDQRVYSLYEHRSEDRWHYGFCWVILVLFVVTALWPFFTPEARARRAQEREQLLAIFPSKLVEFRHFVETQDRIAQEKGTAYTLEDYFHVRKEIYPHMVYFSEVGKWEELNPLERWYLQAKANADAAGYLVGPASAHAEMVVGEPEELQKVRAQSWQNIKRMTGKAAHHSLWFGIWVMPMLLLARLVCLHGFHSRVLAGELRPRLWWFALCCLLWPFLATAHAERQPRETMRFWFLRFRYLLTQRKPFLTVAEKEALLEKAGTAEQDVEAIIVSVRRVGELATGAASRYALAATLSAMVPVNLGSAVATALAQTPALTQSATQERPRKLDVSLDGFVIMTVAAEPPKGSLELDMLRLKSRIARGKLSFLTELDPTAEPHVLAAIVRYEVDPHFALEAGRLYPPILAFYPPPLTIPSLHFPFSALALPFADNGITVSGKVGRATYLVGLFQGSGEYRDNNDQPDYAVQAGVVFHNFTLQFTGQRGEQPEGMRTLYGIDTNAHLGPVAVRGVALKRPDRRALGFLTEVTVRDGPTEYVALVEQTREGPRTSRHLDLGLNRKLTDELKALAHVILGTDEEPRYLLQLRYSF